MYILLSNSFTTDKWCKQRKSNISVFKTSRVYPTKVGPFNANCQLLIRCGNQLFNTLRGLLTGPPRPPPPPKKSQNNCTQDTLAGNLLNYVKCQAKRLRKHDIICQTQTKSCAVNTNYHRTVSRRRECVTNGWQMQPNMSQCCSSDGFCKFDNVSGV